MAIKDLVVYNELVKQFGGDICDRFEYNIKCINAADFELVLDYKAKSKVLKSVFKQLGAAVSKIPKYDALATANPDLIEKFDVPDKMLNRVHTAVKKNINKIAAEVKKDKVHIIRSKVERCTFRNIDKWTYITVKVVGQYAFK